MKYVILIILTFITTYIEAGEVFSSVNSKACVGGPHNQPNGSYSIYVFCDDALGTNIAIYLNRINSQYSEKYELGKRFWQGEPWAYDVTSYAWLPNKNQIIIATSSIYGSGSLYLLNVDKQESKILYHLEGAVLEIKKITRTQVTLSYEVKNGATETVQVAI